MVVNMIKWRPRSPIMSKKFEVKFVVHSIKGLRHVDCDDDDENNNNGLNFDNLCKFKVEIKWKGSKTNGFRSLKKKGVKNSTREEGLGQNGVVLWDEEFRQVCEFCGSKEKMNMEEVYCPWEVSFVVFYKKRNKAVPLTAPAVLNVAEFASLDDVNELDINIPLSILHRGYNYSPSIFVSLSLTKLKTTKEPAIEMPKPTMFAPLSPCFGASPLIKKDETSKSSLRKVKSLTDYVSSRMSKKAYHEEGSSDSKFSTGSEDSEYNCPSDTDSFDDTDEGDVGECREKTDVQISCSYGNLVHVNLAGRVFDQGINCEDDNLIYYGRHKPHVDSSLSQDFGTSVSDQVLRQSPKFRISWNKGKLSFKSRRIKGEPLLKKDYREDGGDDIDFDRRQYSSDDSLVPFDGSTESGSYISEFGDDNFAVGSWEQKEIPSRDGSMKLKTQIFFASIDQRSERADGESACTALVAVFADWLHSNQGEMPIKSEFDSLIREGSFQWRKLCENEYYREKFPDKHFDLETVVQAKIRPLTVIPERSFIGFFHPDGFDQEQDCFSFLQGAMSFDNIWDEISRVASEMNCNSEPLVYVVSWNDHFFILRIDWDAYYIIDTLGERLYEGCKQAYVLKFNHDTIIESIPCRSSSTDDKTTKKGSTISEASSSKEQHEASDHELDVSETNNEEEKVICKGKESCKEYIKSFLAALPIREMQIDMKKGLMSSTPLHHRLQIEFNYTKQSFFLPPPAEYIVPEKAGDLTEVTDVQASMVVDVRAPMMVADSSTTVEVPASMITVAVA